MILGKSGLYGKTIHFKHERTKTIYEVLHFKAGRPPTREEVLDGLRAELAALETKAAAARARTGAELVDLTYRSFYVEDPNGQWQGYQDANTNRAWGLAEWGSRAWQGALFDWIVGNAASAPDPDRG